MDIAGYFASVFIGIALGLIGGGGSILTVPVLVYLFRIDALLATTYSLFIVGAASTIGSVSYFRKGLINIHTAIVFGIPSIIAVFLTRAYLVPAIPENIFSIGKYILTKDILLMLFFAVLMVLASYSMIKRHRSDPAETVQKQKHNYPLILIQGALVGMVTGLVGSGGGFLIIPALVGLLKMPMKTAVGTSLFIIAVNSCVGFLFSLSHSNIHWGFLSGITAIAIIGIFAGMTISKRTDGKKLKPAFGWFVLAMGIYIILKETLLN